MENHSNNPKRRSYILNNSINIMKLIKSKELTLKELVEQAYNNILEPDFRSIAWRIYLNILPFDKVDSWKNITNEQRTCYFSFKNTIAQNIQSIIESESVKVSRDTDDSLTSKELDLLNIIKLDISRTNQDIDLFRNDDIKHCLIYILYIWCKEMNNFIYIQGMNEIVATIVYSIYGNYTLVLNTNEENELYYFLNNEDYFEADVYIIFKAIMDLGLRDIFDYSYKSNSNRRNSESFELIDKTKLSVDDIESTECSTIQKRINKIFYVYLKIVDNELFLYLNDKLEPYTFLFRWIICLLIREVPLKDLSFIFDTILAGESCNNLDRTWIIFKKNLNFLDFLCVSMIIYLKKDLYTEDNECFLLRMLLNFPQNADFRKIVKNALMIQNHIINYYNIESDYFYVL